MITRVQLNGTTVRVPPGTLQVYVAETHANTSVPNAITAQLMTTDLMQAWQILVHDLVNGGWGRVVAYDLAFPIEPRWSRDLGRIDGPTRPEIMLGEGTVPINTCGKCGAMGTWQTCPRCG